MLSLYLLCVVADCCSNEVLDQAWQVLHLNSRQLRHEGHHHLSLARGKQADTPQQQCMSQDT